MSGKLYLHATWHVRNYMTELCCFSLFICHNWTWNKGEILAYAVLCMVVHYTQNCFRTMCDVIKMVPFCVHVVNPELVLPLVCRPGEHVYFLAKIDMWHWVPLHIVTFIPCTYWCDMDWTVCWLGSVLCCCFVYRNQCNDFLYSSGWENFSIHSPLAMLCAVTVHVYLGNISAFFISVNKQES